MDLPEAPILIDRLKKALEKENELRNHFYQHISEQHKSEFINGETIIHSPVRIEHNEVNGNLYKIIDTYVVAHDLGFVGIEKILIALTRNDYEPDVCFFNKEKADTFKKGQQFFPAPDLIIEVLSPSTEQRDRGIKFQDYEKHEVGEYWLVNTEEKQIEQYLLINGKYELILKSQTGTVSCPTITDLKLPIPVIFDKKLTNEFVKSI